jgi:endonuclease YncB( thermonuclease family)
MMYEICGFAMVLAFAPALSLQAPADEYNGQASVVDGDTLEIHGQRIQLSGIDAPEAAPKPISLGMRITFRCRQ